MPADRMTVASAGFGAIMALKRMPPTGALLFAVTAETVSQVAERTNPGISGGNGGSPVAKSVLDVGVCMLTYWLLRE